MNKKGLVYYEDQLAGIITENYDGYSFAYDKEYIKAGGKPVSLTLPIANGTYGNKTLFPFFDGLIPEGWLLNLAADHWKLDRMDRFALLLTLCRDCIGAVSVIPES
ncbi:HipA N-terminal domain-containing protein [Flavitalea flava]